MAPEIHGLGCMLVEIHGPARQKVGTPLAVEHVVSGRSHPRRIRVGESPSAASPPPSNKAMGPWRLSPIPPTPLCLFCPRSALHGGGGRGGGGPKKKQRALSYQMKNSRWRPAFALDTGGTPNTDDQDFEEDSGFLGRTRLGRIVQAAAKQLLEKLNSARSNSPTKIFLVLLGFYTANALATILGQTGDWDVLVAGVVVAAIEGIGMLMYRKPFTRPPGRFQSLIAMANYWKAGVCLGLFVDAFKLGS